MIRPNDVVAWYKLRAQRGQNELAQLVDGLAIGGSIVVGGPEANVHRALPLLSNLQRVGAIKSMATGELDPGKPTTFDTAAIVQLVMVAKNESFHETSDLTIRLIEQLVADEVPIEQACATAREQAALVQKL